MINNVRDIKGRFAKGNITPSPFFKGHTPWNKGKMGVQPRSEETKKKISNSLKGRIKPWLRGKPLSAETRLKQSLALRGEKSHLWKDGRSKVVGYSAHIRSQRRARKLANGGSHTLGEWDTLKAQYNWTCPPCGQTEPQIKLTIDHIIPVSRGGSDNIENIQPLCARCNSKKRTKTIKYELK